MIFLKTLFEMCYNKPKFIKNRIEIHVFDGKFSKELKFENCL